MRNHSISHWVPLRPLSLFMVIVWGTLLGCESHFQPNRSPELSLSRSSLIFPTPSEIGAVVEVELEIHNVSRVSVKISEVRLEEEDDTPEVTLLDAEDWTNEAFFLAPDERQTLRLRWSPTNQQPDRGALIIDSSAGVYNIPFESPDLDPALRLESRSDGELGATQGSVTLTSEKLRDRVKIQSIGLVPLELSRICFIDSDDTCLSSRGEVGRGQLSLCRVGEGEECEPYQQQSSLTLLPGEELSFILDYRPTPEEVDSVVGRLLIESDAAESPRYLLRVEGQPCAECQEPPPAGEEPPPAGEEPPPAGEDPPPAGEDPPPAGEEPPPAGEDPPPAGEEPPPAGEEPPPAGEDPPPAGEELPPEREERVYDQPGVHQLALPSEVSTISIEAWGAGGAAGNQEGADGGGAASTYFQLNISRDLELAIWVGEAGSRPGEGGGGSFIWDITDPQNPRLLAAIAGGGGGASDGNSGNSWRGGRGGSGGWSRGLDGQGIIEHQRGQMLDYCIEATGGSGATAMMPGEGGVSLGTANGCPGQAGEGSRGGGMTSRPSGDGVTCIPSMEPDPWRRSPAQGNGGGGGGGGGYFGGGSGGFIWTYCGGGGGGGSSWVTEGALDPQREEGQARAPGRSAESDGAGWGGLRLEPMSPPDDERDQGANGRVIISW